MTPELFRAGLLDRLTVPARPAPADKTGSGMTYGVITAVVSGGEAWWQIAARAPRTGSGAPGQVDHQPPALPETGPTPLADIEQALAAAAVTLGDPVAVTRYSQRDRPPTVGYGLTVAYADGSAMFVQLHWSLRPGEARTDANRYKPQDAI
ncbi:hypothetical protein [Streptomyces sp. NBC_01207]|uniref:hypothetical protein n=1 Tax=Streptomyces sp. NBC_01207 TaxID=2903772 RepID=UPI002E0FF2CE|nr:hypothetical protein OG457_27320 [Streptomyces sp. NBC_01207]